MCIRDRSYVGALGRNLPGSIDRNYPVYGPGATAANVNTRRPYMPGTIGSARVLESTFASDYHALQTSVERRGSRWSAKAYYTFGKAMEDIDYQGGGLPAVQNSNRIELERARTSNDRTHAFTMSGIWNVNYLDDTHGAFTRGVLNGWTVSAIITMQSGQPLTIGAGQDRNFDGLTSDRADLVGNPVLDASRPREEQIEEWFSRAAFALPAVGTDGNGGRNIVEGPGVKNVDFGLFRDLPLGGRTLLQLRLEATNMFNFVNLNNPDTGLNNTATFGRIRTARDMRRVQIGGRLSF